MTSNFSGAAGAGPVHALGPVDLDLRRGEFFAVVGPSGCGKSTLLDVIAGLPPPTDGTVPFEGRPIAGGCPTASASCSRKTLVSLADRRRQRRLRPAPRRLDAAEIERRVDYALASWGLPDFAKAYPAQLSGGMRQRVCIARTLVMQPRLILLDEPFGALDQQTRLLMGDELLRLWRETGATVLLITHALDEAAMLSDRIGVMSARPGRFIDMVETGWPRERDSRIVATPRSARSRRGCGRSCATNRMKTIGKPGWPLYEPRPMSQVR